jgi:glucosamine-6-phosphate deaminase
MGMNEPQVIAGIQTWIDHDSESASDRVARLIAAQIHDKPDSVLGLATGGTPVGAYRRLIAMNESGEVDFARVTTFNLDEYVGLAGDHPQSYRAFMNTQLFDHVNVAPQRTFVPDGRAADPTAHCQQYESRIRQAGGIDLQLLGLGHNGHIAFNEPGSPRESRTRQVDLTAKTIESNARFFDSIEQVPRHAITMGIATILEARQIVMLVLGEGKAEAVAQMFHGSVGEDFPAAWLREHPRVTVVLDRPAAKLLETSTP